MIALLKEDKPAVFVDLLRMESKVQFSNLANRCQSDQKPAEANQVEKEEPKGREGIVFDIEGVDSSGQDIAHHPSLVKIPVDKDKEVEHFLFPRRSWPLRELMGHLYSSSLYSNYAIVYKPAQRKGPDQPIHQR